jgi:hypothetical protein
MEDTLSKSRDTHAFDTIEQDDGVPPAPPAPESVPFGSVTDSMLDMLTAAQAKGGDEDPNVRVCLLDAATTL